MAFSGGAVVKPGTIQSWGGNAAPDGWLLCDGSAISRELYAELFGVIGTKYGAGDGSTTFNIPNCRNIVNYIDANVSVKGNGMTLGLTDGTNKCGMQTIDGGSCRTAFSTNTYGKNVGTTSGTNYAFNGKSIGITTDSSKSGIVGTVNRAIVACEFIIKY